MTVFVSVCCHPSADCDPERLKAAVEAELARRTCKHCRHQYDDWGYGPRCSRSAGWGLAFDDHGCNLWQPKEQADTER